MIAGSADVASFLGFAVFSAHVTGNLVILIAHIVARKEENECLILSLLIFVLILCCTRVLVSALEAFNMAALRPLLWLQFLMLTGSFALCLASGRNNGTATFGTALAAQLSVAAMAVQNGLVQLLFPKASSTTVMTTNLTRLIMDAGGSLMGRDPAGRIEARRRANETWPVVVGFAAGAGLGAGCFAAIGNKSLGLPAGLALVAVLAATEKRA